ncbi:TIGR02253 family HAD-type hydrolase [Candidatus Micrarchaeota archaeon]|nr:TIGR02253 family HAD-type hydrolase [Candidatus Micrarchaeota archaeon]
MVKNVFIDIDDTLFPTARFAKLARKKAILAMIKMGLEGNPDELYEKLSAIIKKRGPNYDHHFDELCSRLKVKEPAKYVAAAIGAYHKAKYSIRPYPGVVPALRKLKASGYRLYVATNGSEVKQWDKLILLNLHHFFEGVFISEGMGMEKNTEFFRKALRKIRAKPEDCVMVGDKPSIDLFPPKKVGMKAVRALMGGRHVNSPGEADASMHKFSELPKILKKL